jgi:hypothetical protein
MVSAVADVPAAVVYLTAVDTPLLLMASLLWNIPPFNVVSTFLASLLFASLDISCLL